MVRKSIDNPAALADSRARRMAVSEMSMAVTLAPQRASWREYPPTPQPYSRTARSRQRAAMNSSKKRTRAPLIE